MTIFHQLIIGFIASSLIVTLALWRHSLSRSGGVGALIVGTTILGFGGWKWGILLGVFFISSSLLSHFKEEQKKAVAEKFDKGHERDFAQVLANGGLGAILAVAFYLFPNEAWLMIYIGVMATVTADTWATELGTLSNTPPRLITSGKIVDVGTSGGISRLGTAVSFAGGLLIGLSAGFFSLSQIGQFLFLGGFSGLAGSFFDSFLGATVQAVYYSKQKQKETEKKFDSQGQPNQFLRGWTWLTNDLVNLFASIVGGLVSYTLYIIWISI